MNGWAESGIGVPEFVGSAGIVMITTVEAPLLSLIETPLRMIGGSALPFVCIVTPVSFWRSNS